MKNRPNDQPVKKQVGMQSRTSTNAEIRTADKLNQQKAERGPDARQAMILLAAYYKQSPYGYCKY